MIIDSNIIIDFLKGKEEAINFLTQLDSLKTSVVVVAELYSGVANHQEMLDLKNFLEFITLVELNSKIAETAGLLRRDYYKSYGIEIPDAIIAATANMLNEPVATLDKKHFSIIAKQLVVPY